MPKTGRPKSSNPKNEIVQVKFTRSERAELDRLVEICQKEAAARGAPGASISSVIRGLIRDELAKHEPSLRRPPSRKA